MSVAGGTATAGIDFAAVDSFTLTIAANETSGTATFNLTPTDDSLVEDVETVKVSGSTGGDLTVLAATLEITDDDQPSYVLAVNPATIAEAGGLSTVTVSTGGVSFPADQTIALGFAGSATKGTDYSVDTESLTLTTGQTSVSTTVRAVDDEVMVPDETIDITATLDGKGIGTSQTVTIVDNETAATRVAAVAGAGNGRGGCRRDGRDGNRDAERRGAEYGHRGDGVGGQRHGDGGDRLRGSRLLPAQDRGE